MINHSRSNTVALERLKVRFYVPVKFIYLFVVFYVAFNSQGHIAMGGGNQCILHCKPPGIGK